jgi:hypothetical protein
MSTASPGPAIRGKQRAPLGRALSVINSGCRLCSLWNERPTDLASEERSYMRW